MRFFLSYFIINFIRSASSISIQDWSNNDIVIDVDKGYALRRLGVYSSHLVEEIVHTFIPLTNFFDDSPQSDICLHASSSKGTTMLPLSTIMAPSEIIQPTSSYNRHSIYRLIKKDLTRVIEEHHQHDNFKSIKSITHFVNNKFYYRTNNDSRLMMVPFTPYEQLQ